MTVGCGIKEVKEMTKEEKQKAIAALKLSAPVKAMTQEEFRDYIQTINKIMDWLEQESCEDAVSRKWLVETLEAKGFGLTDTDYNRMIHLIRDTAPSVQPKTETVTEFADRCRECGKQKTLDKIRAEIEDHCGLVKENHCKYCSYCHNVMGIREILELIDKYSKEEIDG